jgi:hypothetical protein
LALHSGFRRRRTATRGPETATDRARKTHRYLWGLADQSLKRGSGGRYDDDLPRFTFKPQERPELDVIIIPQARPEIIAQVGGIPVDGLPELHGGGFHATGLQALGLMAL